MKECEPSPFDRKMVLYKTPFTLTAGWIYDHFVLYGYTSLSWFLQWDEAAQNLQVIGQYYNHKTSSLAPSLFLLEL